MQVNLFEIQNKTTNSFTGIDSYLSFEPFLSYLKERCKIESQSKKGYLNSIINEIEQELLQNGEISLDNLALFESSFKQIYNFLTPPIANECDILWAIGVPMGQAIVFGSPKFYDLLKQNLHEEHSDVNHQIHNQYDLETNRIRILYTVILENLYNFKSPYKFELIYSITDTKSNLPKYYKINIDNRFINAKAKNNILPKLDTNFIKTQFAKKQSLNIISEVLPIDEFVFYGFSILTLEDITASYALENIKNIIIKNDAPNYYKDVITSIKAMIGRNDIDFSLLAFFKLNNKYIIDTTIDVENLLLKMIKEQKIEEKALEELLNEYITHPEVFSLDIPSINSKGKFENFKHALTEKNIKTFAIIPIFYNTSIVGILEISSKKEHVLDESAGALLISATSTLAQFLKDKALKTERQINDIVKEKFTSLQPSVEWKFNESAWNYIQELKPNTPKPNLGNIRFENVYPLYGAIDIRNSTVERNIAATNDLNIQLNILLNVLIELKKSIKNQFIDELIQDCKEWISSLSIFSIDYFLLKINDFLEKKIPYFFNNLKKDNKSVVLKIIKIYEDAIIKDSGRAFENRRDLEASIQMINSVMSMYLDLFNDELQLSFPCYFEKFRTDGIEYDIYIGQSIAPQQKFSSIHLNKIKLWQLTSMAALAKMSYGLLTQMKKPLQTTQLIFVSANTIDISFRSDERRFDVEGAYNIRYHIIKKRIDKVKIKNTKERLTQPGKIAIVYFNEKDIEIYKSYITDLQNKEIFYNDLEELELEELQGVSGLKALRISVNLDPLTE